MRVKLKPVVHYRCISAAVLMLLFLSCSKNKGAGFAPPPMPVETADVTKGIVADRFEAIGTLEAVNAITVVSQIDAVVLDLPFREGSLLQKGELIAQLDDAQLQAQKARAEALRDQRKTTYDRVKSLVEQKLGAPQDLDDAAAALKVAEADLALIQAQLSKTRIVAPFDGLVGARRVSPGAFLRSGEGITDLAQIDQLRVIFYAPERYLSDLRPGSQVTVSTTAYPGYEPKGQVTVVEPMVDPSTRSVKVIAQVGNLGSRFRPGLSANVSAVLGQRQDALVIPDEAIFAEGDQNLVYVIKPDSSVTRTPVTLGTRLQGTVEVLKGLEPGMKIVRAGHQKLFEGAKVRPMPQPEADTKAGDKS